MKLKKYNLLYYKILSYLCNYKYFSVQGYHSRLLLFMTCYCNYDL